MSVLTRQTGSTDAARGAGFGAGFWIVGFAFAVAMAFSTVPAPLYVLYQARDQFSALLVTVIFAATAYRANCARQRGPRRGPRSPRPPPTSAASASARCWPACWHSTRGRRCGCRIW